MNPERSITSTESFAARAQRSEARRAALWTAVLGALLLITIGRRLAGGIVMNSPAVFWPTISIILLAIGAQMPLLYFLRRANRAHRLLPFWVWRASAAFDLAVPMALLFIVGFFSPRGPVSELSGPTFLLLPMAILLSVLRLRPVFTLATGLVAAAFHAALALRAGIVTGAALELYVVYFAYAAMLLCIGFAGMLVAREIKTHVTEAANEAAERERADHGLALVQRDLRVARDIQAGLLPAAPPIFDGFELAGMNRPADLTGGDYYDWQIMPDGRLIAVMADVSGHGIGPALVMAVCRAYARASTPSISDPALLMTHINALLHSDLPADRFITFALAMIEPGGSVQLVSAGHGPSFLYNARTRKVREFGGDGLPLGISMHEEYGPPASFDMDEGDILVLLTDGFFERQRDADHEQYGIERLAQAILTHANQKPAALLSTLDEAVRAFAAGSKQQDDMTAVVIQRTRPSRRSLAAQGDPILG